MRLLFHRHFILYHFLPWIMVSYTPICLQGPSLIHYGEPEDKSFYLAVTRPWNAENAGW